MLSLASVPELCKKCGIRAGTENWGGTHDSVSLARNHHLIQKWCLWCVTEFQLEYCKGIAAKVPELEARMEKLKETHE